MRTKKIYNIFCLLLELRNFPTLRIYVSLRIINQFSTKHSVILEQSALCEVETKLLYIFTLVIRRLYTSSYTVMYGDVLPGNASVICGFCIYYSDLLVIHQVELQLLITLSVFHIRPVF
jgi:hypothetical protein